MTQEIHAHSITGMLILREPLLRFFKYEHLPPYLAEIFDLFGKLAVDLLDRLPDNEERHTAIRKLLEAKDCAVRAHLYGGT